MYERQEPNAWAELARTHGPDVMIETAAQCFDALDPFMRLGDLLRDLWRDIQRELIDYGASSGAAHELEYYGGGS